ncbi:MAG: lamin tail domain-containing protein [Planctomycetota bacterium]|nr:lamin tail domain-containing protein [Planctomycetota bacterium]
MRWNQFAVCLLAFVVAGFSSVAANAAMFITEFMYRGDNAGGEFIELTNTGGAPIDMTGWSYDDNTNTPGSFSLSGFGIVAPGETVLITEAAAADFRTTWGLPGTIKVAGGSNQGIGNGDEINIYDGSNALMDRLTFGSSVYPRTQERAAVPKILGALGTNTHATNWEFTDLMAGGGVYDLSGVLPPNGWVTGIGGATGNPGYFQPVPEPTSIALAGIAVAGGVAMAIRRRKLAA